MATRVIISPNINHTRERINPNGDVIDPKTKQIIKPNIEENIPAPQAPQGQPVIANKVVGTLSVLEQIKEAKANLKALEELKKLKIEEKKKELELLQEE